MSRQIINETYSLQVPDTFEPMDGEDLRDLSRGSGDPFQWGMKDRENHVMVIAMWKRYPALLSLLADPKSLVKKNEQLTRKLYEGHGYRFLGFLSVRAGEERAEGYRFSYSAEGIAHTRTNFLIRDGKTIYAFIYAGREENADSDLAVFSRMMESLEYV